MTPKQAILTALLSPTGDVVPPEEDKDAKDAPMVECGRFQRPVEGHYCARDLGGIGVKYILIVCDQERVSLETVTHPVIGKWFADAGIDALVLFVYDAPEPISVIDLSNLPHAEIEEIRRLIKEKLVR